MELKNFTVPLPAGTSNHGDPRILCPPPSWQQMVVFFVTNYVAHAATVRLPPGSPSIITIGISVAALLMPATGLVYGLTALGDSLKSIKASELQRATIAGALCMYVRSTDWPPAGHTINAPVEIASFKVDTFQEATSESSSFLRYSSLARKSPSKLVRLIASSMALIRLQKMLYFQPEAIIQLLSRSDNGMILSSRTGTASSIELEPRNRLTARSDNTSIQPQASDDLPGLFALRGSMIEQSFIGEKLTLVSSRATVHGDYHQIPGYRLAFVPQTAIVNPMSVNNPDQVPQSWKNRTFIAKTSNLTRGLVALAQLCASVFTLAQARGDQIELYGFAAFSLTVAPYAVMAAVNLLANAFMPSYPALYLVRNDVMTEIEQSFGLTFSGVVGAVGQPHSTQPPDYLVRRDFDGNMWLHFRGDAENSRSYAVLEGSEVVSKREVPRLVLRVRACEDVKEGNLAKAVSINFFMSVLGLCLAGAPIAIVGGMSHFDYGTASTATQRAVLMVWLGIGQGMGLILATWTHAKGHDLKDDIPSNGLPTMSLQLVEKLGIGDIVKCHPVLLRNLDCASLWTFLSLQLFRPEQPFPPTLIESLLRPLSFRHELDKIYSYMSTLLVYGFPAVWGLVVVGQMLQSYGYCIKIY